MIYNFDEYTVTVTYKQRGNGKYFATIEATHEDPKQNCSIVPVRCWGLECVYDDYRSEADSIDRKNLKKVEKDVIKILGGIREYVNRKRITIVKAEKFKI